MIPPILKRLEGLGFAIFVRGEINVNLISIRSPTRTAGAFDDEFVCVYRERGEWNERRWPITTDPGVYWLERPMRLDGCAIRAPGQARGAYALGRHKGKPALVQIASVPVYRDNNRDDVLDMDPSTIENGVFGINIHRAGSASSVVGKWSAGCQVFARSSDLDELLEICERSAAIHGPRFSHTLIER